MGQGGNRDIRILLPVPHPQSAQGEGGYDAKGDSCVCYVCQSNMKRGKGACRTPRLSARRFEEMVAGQIRSIVLTEGNIRDFVRLVNEEIE